MQQEQQQKAQIKTFERQTTAIFIANPTSGSYQQYKDQLEETLGYLEDQGWKAELRLTQARGDATRLAREAVEEGADIAVAVGGDGTINEVVQGLVGSETALGVLPLGTVNVWARETDIPLGAAEAREVLLHGVRRKIDLGQVDTRYFLLMAGIGFDGAVTQIVEKKSLKKLGVIGYLLGSIWVALKYNRFPVVIRLGEKQIKTMAYQIIIGNTQLYAGALKFTWQAKCDDGLLDICIVKYRNRLDRFLGMMDFLINHRVSKEVINYETSAAIEIITKRPIPMQIDGDPVGKAPAHFKVVPEALNVIVPESASAKIFSKMC